MIGFLKRLKRDKRGNVLIITAAAMPMLVGMAGLATDTIQWALWKRQLQRAADSAAIAGVYERNATNLGATTGVPTAVTRDLTMNQHAGILDGAPIINYPADDLAAPGGKRVNQVMVTLKVTKKLAFSSFFSTTPTITVSSTAASVPGAGEYCVIALDSRDTTGAEMGGSTHVDLGDCCLIANAKHANKAFAFNGNGSTVKAGCIAAVGGVEESESSKWDVDAYYPYSEPALDPYSHLEVPLESECQENITVGNQLKVNTDWSTTAANHTGKVICLRGGFDIKAKLTLGAATYVIDTNGESDDLRMTESGASLNCTGCTIVMTNFDEPKETANFRLNGGSVNLSPPVDATHRYNGVTIFQDRRALDDDERGANHINGNNTIGIRGVIYLPSRSLLYNGSGSIDEEQCMQLIAARVDFTGNSKFKMGSLCGGYGMKGQTGGGWLVRLVA